MILREREPNSSRDTVPVRVSGGSYVVAMVEDWDIAPGTVTTRAKVAARFGGALYGGIQPSRKSPNIMLFTDPVAGRRHGYTKDGWGSDGAFYYTGEGPDGDQEFIRGNRMIRDHLSSGRALRLFESLPAPAGVAGGKVQKYLGEFRVDPSDPYRRADADGSDHVPRTVIVFKLLPVDAMAPEEPVADTPAAAAGQEFVPVENNVATEFEIAANLPSIGERREAKLMAQLEATLREQKHDVGRLRLLVPGSTDKLVTDTYDSTSGVLYEVKGTSTRPMVRLAIGQLLDYQRFANDVVHCTVVLPVRPATDLVELIHSVGFELVVREEHAFVRVTSDGTADLR